MSRLLLCCMDIGSPSELGNKYKIPTDGLALVEDSHRRLGISRRFIQMVWQ